MTDGKPFSRLAKLVGLPDEEPDVQEIKLAHEHYEKMFYGPRPKRQTVRLGVKPYQVGYALLVDTELPYRNNAYITAVQLMKVGDLTDEHAHADGFPHLNALLHALKDIYGQVKDSDTVTVVTFALSGEVNL